MSKHIRTLSLCIVLTLLLAAAACSLCGCARSSTAVETSPVSLPVFDPGTIELPEETFPPEVSAALEGSCEFTFEVTGADGVTQSQIINTTCTTVGEALMEYGMIEGEEGEYGLYVKTVLGETHDYDEDGMYWAFYINGEYAATGAELTEIVPGTVYAFRAE